MMHLLAAPSLNRFAVPVRCRREKGLSGSENGRYANRETALMFPIVQAPNKLGDVGYIGSSRISLAPFGFAVSEPNRQASPCGSSSS
jgi:hypothetical protein